MSFNKENLVAGVITGAVASTDTSISVTLNTDTVSGAATPSSASDALPTTPFFATLSPAGVVPNFLNSEIVQVTNATWDSTNSCWVFTVVRAQRETTARAFAAKSVFSNAIYVEDVPEGSSNEDFFYFDSNTSAAALAAAYMSGKPCYAIPSGTNGKNCSLGAFRATGYGGGNPLYGIIACLETVSADAGTSSRVISASVDLNFETDKVTIGSGSEAFSLKPLDLLTSTTTKAPLSAAQGRALNLKIEGRVIQNAGAPTTSTVGTVGMLLEDTTNGDIYKCTAVDTSSSPAVYTWEELGGGGGGGDDAIELTQADYNYEWTDPNTGEEASGVALWKLPAGHYKCLNRSKAWESKTLLLAYIVRYSEGTLPVIMDRGADWDFHISRTSSSYASIFVYGVSAPASAGPGGNTGRYVGTSFAFFVFPDNYALASFQGRRCILGGGSPDNTVYDILDITEYNFLAREFSPNYEAAAMFFASRDTVSISKAGLVPIIPSTSGLKQFTSNGWQPFAQADYIENDSDSGSYIQNRPFYEETTYSETTLTSEPNDVGTQAENLESSFFNNWLSSIGVTSSGYWLADYDYSGTASTVISAIENGDKLCLLHNNSGRFKWTWFNMDSESEGTVYIKDVYLPAWATATHTYGGETRTFRYAIVDVEYSLDNVTWNTGKFIMCLDTDSTAQYRVFSTLISSSGSAVYPENGSQMSSGIIAKYTESTVIHKLDPQFLNLTGYIVNGGTTAPTASTPGVVGTLCSAVVSGTPHLYSCTAVDTTDPDNPSYTWAQLV